jgi:glycosyltransferase involved in cell wall biosynthesis
VKPSQVDERNGSRSSSADGSCLPFADRILASHEDRSAAAPLLTIAIPHYNHRRYLEVVLQSIAVQDFDAFEVVVSDDTSPDDSNLVIPDLLRTTGLPFRYYAQTENLGYDGNVRFCLSASRGRYVLLLGNDDSLVSPRVLRQLASALEQLHWPQVAFANYESWASPGSTVSRAVATRELGSGPETAIRFFRSFSFVSGLIFERAAATEHETDRWDASIYYQIYLACRIVAAGGRLAALNVNAVRKDVLVDGRTVPNYASKWQNAPRSFESRHTGLDSVLRVAVDAILPYVHGSRQSATVRRIAMQVLLVLYPFWLFEYRRVANWSFAVGVARGLWPLIVLREYSLTRFDRFLLYTVYAFVTVGGLMLPAGPVNRARTKASIVLRRALQRRPAVRP